MLSREKLSKRAQAVLQRLEYGRAYQADDPVKAPMAIHELVLAGYVVRKPYLQGWHYVLKE